MANLHLVHQADGCNLRVPAASIDLRDSRAPMAGAYGAERAEMQAIERCAKGRTTGTANGIAHSTANGSWLHTPKFGPTHHSQRWRRGT